MALVSIREVARHYSAGDREVHALRGVSLEVNEGDFLALTGPSGCGKSTLLHLMGALDQPTAGEVVVEGLDLAQSTEAERTKFRREGVGFVFQFFHLLPTMTVRENIGVPLRLAGVSKKEAGERVDAILPLVGLEHRADSLPHQLSGGEMQRTAVARALVHKPPLILADEPTGNLDSVNAGRVMELFADIHRQNLATVVMVTHSDEVAATASRQIGLRDGQIDSGEG